MLYTRDTMETILAKTMMSNDPDSGRSFQEYLKEATEVVAAELKPVTDFISKRKTPISDISELPTDMTLRDYVWRGIFKCNEPKNGIYKIGQLENTISYNEWTEFSKMGIPKEVAGKLLKLGIINVNRKRNYIIIPTYTLGILDRIANTTRNRYLSAPVDEKPREFTSDFDNKFLSGFFTLLNYVGISSKGRGVVVELSEPDIEFDIFDVASNIGECFIRYLDYKVAKRKENIDE